MKQYRNLTTYIVVAAYQDNPRLPQTSFQQMKIGMNRFQTCVVVHDEISQPPNKVPVPYSTR